MKKTEKMNAIMTGTLKSCGHLSFASRGAWIQTVAAGMLITVLPFLILVWLWHQSSALTELNRWETVTACVFIAALIVLGYALLVKYPVNLIRLRSYLRSLAEDRLPGEVVLSDAENDIAAIRVYLEKIIQHAEERLQLLQSKHEADIEAERSRVMVESLGALCHHIAQPATVLGLHLDQLQRAADSACLGNLVKECQADFSEISKTLDQFRELSRYKTEPYGLSRKGNCRMIKLEKRIVSPAADRVSVASKRSAAIQPSPGMAVLSA